jgi:hypothetical protein
VVVVSSAGFPIPTSLATIIQASQSVGSLDGEPRNAMTKNRVPYLRTRPIEDGGDHGAIDYSLLSIGLFDYLGALYSEYDVAV